MRRTLPIPKTYVRVRRSRAGLGLFSVRAIKKGMYLEYTGKIISNKKADAMKGARYLFELNSKWTIDGSTRQNLARYVNHSCTPNCESVQNGKRVFIKAKKNIPAGEQLTYDYGKEYFDEFIKPFGCVCKKCQKV
jgi:hypothetical protein